MFRNSSLLTVSSNLLSLPWEPFSFEFLNWPFKIDLLKFFLMGDYYYIMICSGDFSVLFDGRSCWYLLLSGPKTLFIFLFVTYLFWSSIFLLRKFWWTGLWLISILICWVSLSSLISFWFGIGALTKSDVGFLSFPKCIFS